jgi:ABC-type transport system substrate-binding protein
MKIHPRAAAAVLAAATAILAAGCGSSGSGGQTASPASSDQAAGSPSDSASTLPTPSASAGSSAAGTSGNPATGTSRCHTSMLSAHVTMGNPGAGQRYAFLVLTNTSTTTCRVYGFPGMQLLSASGGNIPTNVVREPVTPTLVTVAPGKHVYSQLHWTVVPGSGEGSPCEPHPSKVKTTPPDETTSLTTSWPGGSVCQHGQITVRPFKAGTGA